MAYKVTRTYSRLVLTFSQTLPTLYSYSSSVGGLITYGGEGGRKQQAIPDTEVKLCDLVDHDDIANQEDVEAMKSFYGASKISIRLIRVT